MPPVCRKNVWMAVPEQYRRGHNGAVSKTVRVQAHVGSNPTLSAINPVISRCFGLYWVFYFACHFTHIAFFTSNKCSFSTISAKLNARDSSNFNEFQL